MPTLPDRKSARQLPLFPDPEPLSEAKLKEAVRARDGLRCTVCGMTADEHVRAYGQTLQVHRIVPGSEYTIEGCTTLCIPCHAQKSVGAPREFRNPGTISKPYEYHGLRQTPEYQIWYGIIQRCTYPNNRSYKRYGAKGITMCSGWMESMSSFYTDLGPRPTPKHQLDRIDNSLGYFCGHCDECRSKGRPANCRWVTQSKNLRNTSRNNFLEFRGERLTVVEWAERTGVPYQTLLARIGRHGWSVEKALTTPHGSHVRKHTHRGQLLTLREIAEAEGTDYFWLYERVVRLGLDVAEALVRPDKYTPRTVLFRGEEMSLSEVARRSGMPIATLRQRVVRLGMSADDAVSTPLQRGKKLVPNRNAKPTLPQLAREAGINIETVRARIRSGMSREEALSLPVQTRTAKPSDKQLRLI